MTLGYMETLTKCLKCGKNYLPGREFKKCPHKFRDKLSRQLTGQEKISK